MTRRIWLLNAVLLAVFWALGLAAYRAWIDDSDSVGTVDVEVAANGNPNVSIPVSPPGLAAESLYRVVARRNLFSPGRAEYRPPPPPVPVSAPAAEKDVPPEPAVIQGREIRLYGVVLAGDYRKALLDNPEPDQAETPVVWVAPGDAFGGGRILTIEPERVRLEIQGDVMGVRLYEPRDSRRAAMRGGNDRTAGGRPRVLSTGAQPSEKENGPANAGTSPPPSEKQRDMSNPFIRKDVPLPPR